MVNFYRAQCLIDAVVDAVAGVEITPKGLVVPWQGPYSARCPFQGEIVCYDLGVVGRRAHIRVGAHEVLVCRAIVETDPEATGDACEDTTGE